MVHRVGTKDLRNNLSGFLRLVRKGARVIVTDRGRPIAEIAAFKDAPDQNPDGARLKEMAALGLCTLPAPGARMRNLKPVKVRGRLVSEMLVEDRR
jgi:prevent-host-death family protein